MALVHVLPLVFQNEKYRFPVFPVVLEWDEKLLMIDCGYPGFLPQIEKEMAKTGLAMERLSKLVITHHDHDHMGAAREIAERYPTVEILASPEQVPYITGRKKSLRLEQAERVLDSLPEESKADGLEFQHIIASVKPVAEAMALTAGEVLPWCGGVEIIDTSGHMPGHISLFVAREKTLVTGDALVVDDGKLCMAMPQYLLDPPTAQESVKRLLAYDIDKVICFHGGVYEGRVREALQAIMDDFPRDEA